MKDVTGLRGQATFKFDGVCYTVTQAGQFSSYLLTAMVPRTNPYSEGTDTHECVQLDVSCSTGAVSVVGVQLGRIKDGVATVFTDEEVAVLLAGGP